MAEWNLSVRLDGQGTGLARTLRATSRDARAASRDVNALRRDIGRLRQEASRDIRLRVRADATSLRTDVRRAGRQAGSGQGLRIPLRINAAGLRADVQAALAAAGPGQGLGVRLTLTDTMQLRRDVQNAVRWAAWGHRIEIPIGLADRMQLRRDVSDAVRWAQMNQNIRVRVTPDTSALNGLGGTIGGAAGAGGRAAFGLGSLIPLATAAIPLIAGLAANLAPLAGTFAATGGAATAFGIAIAGQVGPLSEAAEAEKAYQEAVQEHGKASAEAGQAQLAYQRKLAALPPETQKAAIALSQLKGEFSDWSDEMSGFTMAPVTKGFTILQELIPALSPEVASFSGQLDRLMNVAGGAISTPGFDALSDKVAALTDSRLDAFTDQVIHLLRVLSQGQATDGALGQILDYARENGPAAKAALQAVGDAIGTLLEAGAAAGPIMLTLVTAVARLVGALPPEVVTVVLQLAAALKLAQLAALGAAAASAGVTRLSTAITALAATSAAAGGGIAGLRAALASLSTGAKIGGAVVAIGALILALHELSDNKPAVEVDALSTSLNTLVSTGKLTGALKTNMDEMSTSIAMVSKSASDNKLAQLTSDFGTWVGIATGPGISDAIKNVDAWDKVMANNVKSGNAKLAAEQFDLLKRSWLAGGGDLQQLKEHTTDYENAQADAAFEQKHAAESMGLFGKAAQDTSARLDAQKASADGLRQSIVALNDVNRAAGSAMSAFEQSIDDATAAAREHGSALRMRDGELDLGSQKARDAEKVLSTLAANTDAAATAAREQGRSWEYVTGIQSKGRQAFVEAAGAMGLSRAQAEALANSYLKIPDKKSTVLEMRTEDAIAGLNAVIAAIQKTPNAKSVTVKALTSDAVSMLEDLGFKVTRLKDGQFQVTAHTQSAKDSLSSVQKLRDGLKGKTITIDSKTQSAITDLEAVKAKVASTKGKTLTMKAPTNEARRQLELLGFKVRDTKGKNVVITVPTGSQRANVGALAGAISGLRNKSVTITTVRRTVFQTVGSAPGTTADALRRQAEMFQADGSVVDFYADGGIQRGGVRHFAKGAENHVAQIAPAGSWRIWGEPETGGEAYVPLARSKRTRSRAIAEETVLRLGGDPSAIQWNANGNVTDWRYDPTSGSLYSPSDAGSAGNKTRKVKGKEVSYFDLGAVERKLWSAGRATAAWNRDLEKVAEVAGGDVAQALASMGKDGVALTKKMANGSKKYIAQMSIALRDLAKTARATLGDYKVQLNHATGNQELFAKNLAKLAAQGFGDLAGQLAAQNDQAARDLAAAAVRDKGKASGANAAAKRANNALTPDQVQQLVAIIAAVKTSKTGIHDVAATTGLGEDVIIATATKATAQIKSSLGGRATRFLADLGKAQKGMAYANGGIRSGIYATRGGAVTFAEPSTGGEAYIPLGSSKRRTAMPVLSDVAGRFGLGLTDASAGRIVIIREQGPLVGQQTWHVTSGGNADDTARKVDANNSYQLRRLARGGVGASR